MATRSTRAGRKTADDRRRFAVDWLREIFLEDLWLKLVALVIAVGFWFAVTGSRAPATMRLRGVPLEFIRPENIEIGNDPTEEVDITLEGSQSRLAEVNARNLVARADLTLLRPGERVARLSPDSVVIDVPPGVRVVSIEPRTVSVRLEPIIEREVEVEPRLEGEVAEGHTRGAVQISPARVKIRGPESHVNAITRIQTETISIANQAETFLTQTAIDTTDLKVFPLESVVTVRIEVAEVSAERRFVEIPVASAMGGSIQPPSASVTVRGARSVVTALRSDDLRLVVETSSDGTLRPRLIVPPNVEGRVELVSTTPSQFAIQK